MVFLYIDQNSGAVNALQDAVILANCLYDLDSYDTKSITEAFKDYHEQRCNHVKSQYETSKLNSKLTFGQVREKKNNSSMAVIYPV